MCIVVIFLNQYNSAVVQNRHASESSVSKSVGQQEGTARIKTMFLKVLLVGFLYFPLCVCVLLLFAGWCYLKLKYYFVIEITKYS